MFNSENKYCHSSLLNITAEFKETPVLLVIDNEIEGLITTDVPKLFIIKNNTYSLIGCTNHLNNHFILKIINDKTFFVIDNLYKNSSPLSYFHQNNKFWRITKLFYQLQ